MSELLLVGETRFVFCLAMVGWSGGSHPSPRAAKVALSAVAEQGDRYCAGWSADLHYLVGLLRTPVPMCLVAEKAAGAKAAHSCTLAVRCTPDFPRSNECLGAALQHVLNPLYLSDRGGGSRERQSQLAILGKITLSFAFFTAFTPSIFFALPALPTLHPQQPRQSTSRSKWRPSPNTTTRGPSAW